MVNILREIVETKRVQLAADRRLVQTETLRQQASELRTNAPRHRLREALRGRERMNVIAEFKRRSPSKGTIREGISASAMARLYERGGAAAISVLTEQHYFAGSLDDLRAVRSTVPLPLLRKDFIFDEYQVFEAIVTGADAILLIVATLDDELLRSLREVAELEYGIDALVEVHTAEELGRALESGATLIGVNNRNLTNFEVSLETSERLAGQASGDVLLVSESGLRSHEDLLRLSAAGYSGFLIGESLMRAENPDEALRRLIEGEH
jgi:indole-3-glycerol phosphate synthase